MMTTTSISARQPYFSGKRPAFEVVAHRGARITQNPDDIAPENTLPCFEAAARRNAAIELDVISTMDGRLVVHHDDETGKIFTLPNGDKPVQRAWWHEMKNAKLNVAGHEADVQKMMGSGSAYQLNPKFHNTKLSTLEEVVDALPNTYFYIELKTYDKDVKANRNNDLEALVAKVIRDKNLYDRVTIISFSRASVKKIKEMDPRIKTGLDFELSKYIKRSWVLTDLFVKLLKNRLGVDSIHPSYETTTPRLVRAAHRQNLKIVPWVYRQTVEEEKQWFEALRKMGVDGLITNAVETIQGLLKGTDAAKKASEPEVSPLDPEK